MNPDRVGPDIPQHCFGPCSKPSRRGRNQRHTATKNVLATCERLAEPGTNIIMEPFVTAVTGATATSQKYARSRADVFSRPPGTIGYIIDATIVDATLAAAAPANNTPYQAGKATEQAFADKVKQYTQERFNVDPSQFQAAAFDMRSAPSKSTLDYLKQLKQRECDSNKAIPPSVVASRLYQRVSVAIIRSVAYNVLEYRLWRVPVAVPRPPAGPGAVPVAVAPVAADWVEAET